MRGGQLVVLDAGIVTAAVAVGEQGQGDYLLAGLVTPAVLSAAAQAALAGGSPRAGGG